MLLAHSVGNFFFLCWIGCVRMGCDICGSWSRNFVWIDFGCELHGHQTIVGFDVRESCVDDQREDARRNSKAIQHSEWFHSWRRSGCSGREQMGGGFVGFFLFSFCFKSVWRNCQWMCLWCFAFVPKESENSICFDLEMLTLEYDVTFGYMCWSLPLRRVWLSPHFVWLFFLATAKFVRICCAFPCITYKNLFDLHQLRTHLPHLSHCSRFCCDLRYTWRFVNHVLFFLMFILIIYIRSFIHWEHMDFAIVVPGLGQKNHSVLVGGWLITFIRWDNLDNRSG